MQSFLVRALVVCAMFIINDAALGAISMDKIDLLIEGVGGVNLGHSAPIAVKDKELVRTPAKQGHQVSLEPLQQENHQTISGDEEVKRVENYWKNIRSRAQDWLKRQQDWEEDRARACKALTFSVHEVWQEIGGLNRLMKKQLAEVKSWPQIYAIYQVMSKQVGLLASDKMKEQCEFLANDIVHRYAPNQIASVHKLEQCMKTMAGVCAPHKESKVCHDQECSMLLGVVERIDQELADHAEFQKDVDRCIKVYLSGVDNCLESFRERFSYLSPGEMGDEAELMLSAIQQGETKQPISLAARMAPDAL